MNEWSNTNSNWFGVLCVCVALSHAHQWTGTTVNVFSAWIEPTNYDRTQCWNTMNAPTHTTTRYRQIQQDEISLSILTLQNLQINGFKTSAINSIFRFCLKNINRNCCWTLTLILSPSVSLSHSCWSNGKFYVAFEAPFSDGYTPFAVAFVQCRQAMSSFQGHKVISSFLAARCCHHKRR